MDGTSVFEMCMRDKKTLKAFVYCLFCCGLDELIKPNRALILAAGKGTRLKNYVKQKAVHYIDGIPILGRILLGLKEAGIKSVVIVIGYKADNIRQEFGKNYCGLDVSYIVAENWKKGNLHSFLAAKQEFNESFILCMGDHLFDSQIVEKLKSFDFESSIVLAIDRVGYSLDDTKIFEKDGILINIGTDINPSNGVNTGFFLCAPKLFSYAEIVAKEGKTELDDCIRVAAKNKDTQIVDISGYYWIDVDTKIDLERAKNVLDKHSNKK